MANEVVSIGITLAYKNGTAGEFIELANLSEIPDLGGEVEAIEVTNLSDKAHRYVDGLKNYGDSLEFKFYYEGSQFEALNGLTGVSEWKVTLPDEATCTFSGSSSVKLDGVGMGAVLTYTLAVKPNSEMVWA